MFTGVVVLPINHGKYDIKYGKWMTSYVYITFSDGEV